MRGISITEDIMGDTIGSSSSRRSFLRVSAACGAHIALMAAASPARAMRILGTRRGRVVAQEPWGRIEEIGDGVWALISTPLQDRITLCNGGFVRGSSGVLMIESFATPQGAEWMATKARELTGRWPDAVVLTHHHGDHTAGIAGLDRDDGAPVLRVTDATRERINANDIRLAMMPPARRRLLDGAELIEASSPSTVDLGGRTVRIVPRAGHTHSDVTVELDDPSVVFCGDLVWNAMFPNYVDATPSRLGRDVRALIRNRTTAYVPGHGPMADGPDLGRFVELLDSVERAARAAHEQGLSAEEAAAAYTVPPSLGEWMMFSRSYPEVAISAWLRELRG
jgi:glyoxylase-like metal-dependent hydrolase (beta-lactamase superfamily II)